MSELEEGVFSPKDYQTNYIKLVSSDGKENDIVALVLELTLHQSIDAPVMFGSVVIVDAQDILANFFVSGNEYLRISIDQSSLNNPIERSFRIYKITERSHSNNSAAKYILHFVSQEAIISSTQLLSKAYKDKSASDVVRDILVNILGVSKINRVEPTTGLHNYVIASKRPLEALQWLAARSYNANPGYAYHSFESRDGFEFVSLQSLFKQKPLRKLIYDIKNSNDEPNSSSDVGKNRGSIENFKILHDFDVLRSTAEGSYSSRLIDVNILSQQFKTSDYTLMTSENQGLLLNKYKTINDDLLLKSPPAYEKLQVSTSTTSDQRANEVDKWLMTGRMHRSLLDSYRIKVSIAGDISLRAGDIMEIDVPKFVAADESKELDEFRSGKYMIADISHVFRNNGTVDSIIEFVSDSYATNLPSAKDLSKVTRK